ncbi:MAG: phenylalanine--tRNA ligase subunit beta, partial [Oscillospiraceae bacterium]
MNLSMKWLSEFVDISVDAREFAEAMTMSGSKVETTTHLGASVINVVVGKIISIEKHPDADKLQICMVDVAEDAPLQIVTAATNVV